MTEQSAITYAANRARQLGFPSFDFQVRSFGLEERETQEHSVVDGLWLLTDVEPGIRISSTAGEYDRTNTALRELSHEHSGQVTLENRGTGRAFVTVVEVTWLDTSEGLPAL